MFHFIQTIPNTLITYITNFFKDSDIVVDKSVIILNDIPENIRTDIIVDTENLYVLKMYYEYTNFSCTEIVLLNFYNIGNRYDIATTRILKNNLEVNEPMFEIVNNKLEMSFLSDTTHLIHVTIKKLNF